MDGLDSSLLSVFPLVRDDSSYLQWQLNLDGGAGPIRRIGRYREARKLKDEMGIILDSLRSYLEVESHIYGMDISEGTTKDSFLVMTGGKERTAEEYRQLLARAGFRMNEVIATSSDSSIIEALPE